MLPTISSFPTSSGRRVSRSQSRKVHPLIRVICTYTLHRTQPKMQFGNKKQENPLSLERSPKILEVNAVLLLEAKVTGLVKLQQSSQSDPNPAPRSAAAHQDLSPKLLQARRTQIIPLNLTTGLGTSCLQSAFWCSLCAL